MKSLPRLDHAIRDDIELHQASDQGRVREANEDSIGYFEPDEPTLFAQKGRLGIVADGMGGAVGGKVASEIAVNAIQQGYFDHAGTNADEALRSAFNRAALEVSERVKKQPDLKGMGSTAVCLLEVNSEILIANVGDSRAYKFFRNKLEQITKDHSVYAEAIREGIPEEEARERYPSNYITNAIGADIPKPKVDIFKVPAPLKPGDLILLCSDGLSDEVDDSTIEKILLQSKSANEATRLLMKTAYNAGGNDNITILLYKYKGGSAVAKPSKAPRASAANRSKNVPQSSTPPTKNKLFVFVAVFSFLFIILAGSFYMVMQEKILQPPSSTETVSSSTETSTSPETTKGEPAELPKPESSASLETTEFASPANTSEVVSIPGPASSSENNAGPKMRTLTVTIQPPLKTGWLLWFDNHFTPDIFSSEVCPLRTPKSCFYNRVKKIKDLLKYKKYFLTDDITTGTEVNIEASAEQISLIDNDGKMTLPRVIDESGKVTF